MTTHRIRPDDVEPTLVLGTPIRFLLTSEQTGGQFTVWLGAVSPGDGVPPHRHEREDEVLFLLEGSLEAAVDGHRLIAGPQDLLYFPAGKVHSFRNPGPEVTRILAWASPGGIDSVMRQVAQLGDRPRMEDVVSLFAAGGVEFTR